MDEFKPVNKSVVAFTGAFGVFPCMRPFFEQIVVVIIFVPISCYTFNCFLSF